MTKEYVGQNGDGTPHFHYKLTGDGHAFMTGKVYGTFTVPDGTAYDVSEPWIEVRPEHAGELSHLIGVHHEEHGHPDHKPEDPFVHLCTDACGQLKREGMGVHPQTGHPLPPDAVPVVES